MMVAAGCCCIVCAGKLLATVWSPEINQKITGQDFSGGKWAYCAGEEIYLCAGRGQWNAQLCKVFQKNAFDDYKCPRFQLHPAKQNTSVVLEDKRHSK